METKLNHSHDVIYSCCMSHPGTNSWRGCASFSEIHASQILLDLLQSRFGQIHQFLQGCSPPKASPHMRKSSAETNFSTICLKTSPFEILLNPLWAVNFIQWVSNISLYAAFYFYTWKWQSLGCNDFSTSYLQKVQQNHAPKVFPKDGPMTNSLQLRLGNGMMTKAFSLAHNVRIVTLHLSVVIPTRHPKWKPGPKIPNSPSPSPNEKENSIFLLDSHHLISLALLLVKDMACNMVGIRSLANFQHRWGDMWSKCGWVYWHKPVPKYSWSPWSNFLCFKVSTRFGLNFQQGASSSTALPSRSNKVTILSATSMTKETHESVIW